MKAFNEKYFSILSKFGISKEKFGKLECMWNEPWRFYHTEKHLIDLLDKIEDIGSNTEEYQILIMVAFFHDVVYKPWSKTNEEDSVNILNEMIYQSFSKEYCKLESFQEKLIIDKNLITNIILDTKNRIVPENALSRKFWFIDNSIWLNGDMNRLLEWEEGIFKEFQCYDYKLYKEGRIDFLKNLLIKDNKNSMRNLLTNYQIDRIETLIKFVESKVPRIAIYAGSFSPRTIGHENVLVKAEEMFDKVIVARGINTEKKNEMFAMPFDWRQTEEYEGLLSAYIEEKEKSGAKIFLVRGLRNGDDLDYEVNQLRHIEKLKSDIKPLFINCDRDVEEISSTAVRALLKINDEKATDLANSYIYKGIEK